MGIVIKIKSKNRPEDTQKALEQFNKSRKRKKSLRDFYGKLPELYGNGLLYQKKLRDEWK